MITKQEYEDACSRRDAADKLISAYHIQEANNFKERMKFNPIFTPDELIFAAFARCKACQAGLAYPKGCGPGHYWDCSGVLLGVVKNPGMEHAQFPFAFYEIKSECQPSANRATTREQK